MYRHLLIYDGDTERAVISSFSSFFSRSLSHAGADEVSSLYVSFCCVDVTTVSVIISILSLSG